MMNNYIKRGAGAASMISKVPEVTIYFWLIKVMCTTVGETFADYLNETVGLGLDRTTAIMGALLLVALLAQFVVNRYVPLIYWVSVVLISVVGTLITDNLTDKVGLALWISVIAFGVALALSFAVWYAVEKTLSIHSIYTTRREGFYWLVILFTFALGTAVGDFISEKMGIGYGYTLLVFVGAILVVIAAYYVLKLNAVLSFWVAYILTRPLGASIGDLLSQSRSSGGLGLGTTITSCIFLGLILLLVVFLTVTRRDVVTYENARVHSEDAAPDAAAVSGSVALVQQRASADIP